MATDPKDERPLAADERWALYTKRGSFRTIYNCAHKPTLCRPDARYYAVRRVRIVPVESEDDLRAENAKLRELCKDMGIHMAEFIDRIEEFGLGKTDDDSAKATLAKWDQIRSEQ